ncbi:MAG: hypothetical protein Q6373_026075 [Candidatus Sigynarchaeota archaeon]
MLTLAPAHVNAAPGRLVHHQAYIFMLREESVVARCISEGEAMDGIPRPRAVLHWVGIGLSVGGALFHATNAVMFRFWWFDAEFTPPILFAGSMATIASSVVWLAIRDRKGRAKVKPSAPAIAWIPALFLAYLALTTSLETVIFFGPGIVLSCAAGYWFIAHERREDASMRRKRAALIVIAAFLASSPVLVDRVFFRPMFWSGCTITRAVSGPESTVVIAAVEGFNASAGYNWCAIPAGDGWFSFYFSGTSLEFYAGQACTTIPDTMPILYSARPYRRFTYSLAGGRVTGNITFTYTNKTFTCRVNGTNVVEYPPTVYHDTGAPVPMFMNASLHPIPSATPASVTLASGYLVHLEASNAHYCGSLCGNWDDWEQWYLVNADGSIHWAVVIETFHAIS